jgi:hypothetical protein
MPDIVPPVAPATPAVPATPEATPPVTPPPANPSPTVPNIGEMAIEELAKANPFVAKMAQDAAEAAQRLAEKEAADEAARVDAAQKKGEWQKLAEESGAKLKETQGQIASMKKGLDDRDALIESMLKDRLAGIPADRHALIPSEYSAMKKLEYITNNAALLGAEPVQSKGAPIPPNSSIPVTDEAKLISEYNELAGKQNRTHTENQLMLEKAKQLKELRAKK